MAIAMPNNRHDLNNNLIITSNSIRVRNIQLAGGGGEHSISRMQKAKKNVSV
jgi:hypothetical protein